MKTKFLFLAIIFSGFAATYAQTTMNIYKNNGTLEQIPISIVDSITYTVSTTGAGVTYNGHTYGSIILGNGQEWMSENLRTVTYRNGDPIPTGLDNASWAATTAGAYAIYNNDSANDTIYGKLYNWYAVSDPRHVCPAGWHEPTDAEWTTLTDYLGGESVAGGKMKSTGIQYWNSPNQDATNSSGFSGLPCGGRFDDGSYLSMGTDGGWWSSSEYDANNSWLRSINYSEVIVHRDWNTKKLGIAVRCLKD